MMQARGLPTGDIGANGQPVAPQADQDQDAEGEGTDPQDDSGNATQQESST